MGLLKDFYNGAMAIPSSPTQPKSGSTNNNLNVSKSSYQVDKNQGRYGIEKQLKNIVADPMTRSKLAGRLWNSRGGSGVSKPEVKSEIDKMYKNGEITSSQARHFKNDLGAY